MTTIPHLDILHFPTQFIFHRPHPPTDLPSSVQFTGNEQHLLHPLPPNRTDIIRPQRLCPMDEPPHLCLLNHVLHPLHPSTIKSTPRMTTRPRRKPPRNRHLRQLPHPDPLLRIPTHNPRPLIPRFLIPRRRSPSRPTHNHTP